MRVLLCLVSPASGLAPSPGQAIRCPAAYADHLGPLRDEASKRGVVRLSARRDMQVLNRTPSGQARSG